VLFTVQAIIGLALVLGQLSLADTVVRFAGLYVAHDISRAKGSLMSALRLSVFGSGLLAIGLVLSTGWIAENFYHQASLTGVLIILATAMPFTTVADVLAAAYRGFGQLWVKVVCVDLARALWVIVALLYLIGCGRSTLLAIAAVFAITSLLAAILMVGLFWRSAYWRLPTIRVPAGDLLRYSLPLLAAGLLSGPIVNTGFPLLLASLASVQAVSYFSLSMSLQLLVNLPVSALEQAALPAWSGQIGSGAVSGLRVSYSFFTRWGYVVASTVFALLFFNPRAVLSFLYGPEYVVAASAIQSLSAVTLFGVATGPNDGMLRALGNTRWIFTSRLIAGIAAIGAAFFFIPQWGLIGGVVAFVISSALTNGLYTAGLFWKHGIHPLDGPYIKTLVASFIAFLFIGFARPYLGDGLAGIGVTTGLYAVLLGALLHALRGLTQQDAQALDGFFQQLKDFASKRRRPDAVR
jgi:O-antigen/teichoic acid export membrane protein